MQTTQNTAKQNYPGSVASCDSRPGNEVGLFYNAPEPTRGERTVRYNILSMRNNQTQSSLIRRTSVHSASNVISQQSSETRLDIEGRKVDTAKTTTSDGWIVW